MSLVLNLQIRIGSRQSSSAVANALDNVARRFRETAYVETLQRYPGDQVTRAILDANGQSVGEWTLKEE